MGDIALRGDQLKKMMAMAKKRDLSFAYCPGNDPKEDVFVLDRKKKPEVIGRVARGESTGTKLGYGTAKVKGRVIELTCERELPQMAKKLKKFLKFEKIPMNVLVLDSSGNVLEEDIEDMPDDGLLDDVADDEGDGNDDVSEAAENEDAAKNAPDAASDDAELLKKLKARALQVQGAIKGVKPDAQAPLVAGFKTAVGALQGGDLPKADDMLTKLERAIAKLSGQGTAADASAKTEDPALKRLAEVSAVLSKRIDALGEVDGASRLRAVHGMLDDQIASGDAKKATGTAKALGDAIARLAEQAAAAPSTDQNPPENADDNAADPGAGWREARADLEPAILDLLQRGMGDVGKMRAVLAYFTEKGEADDFAGAMKAVPGLKKLIADAHAAEQTAAEKDIPAGVVPYVRARLDWSKTRISLNSELIKLQDSILAVCQGEEFPTIATDTKTLFTYLDTLDSRLEDALEALVQEPDGQKRELLKENARKVLSEFQSELDTPFFQTVDGKNGFKPVNVRGAAITSLGKVDEALRTAA
ncbi:hypothetical protein [Roseobacter sp. GAI101]|uniref:hypothetical protein n=1 Tax=Roseobacter sp. (strain GAI101) TaxID=391589 RepID=UPI00018717C5|nr:hypothetical protein [Roseobacter sp. GAI101]EEB82854.1 hypothetical protein RGAI101_4159 [Roseobacter sp. GAI101]